MTRANEASQAPCLVVEVEPHWGVSLNYFLSTKSKGALRVIPPTTLLGALARPIATLMRIPENRGDVSTADLMRDVVRSVHYAIEKGSLIPHTEISKVVTYKVRAKKIVSDAVGVAKTYSSPRTVLRIYYVINPATAEKVLGREWRKVLLQAGWGILRLGAKESIISVRSVDLLEAREVVAEDTVKTSATIPMDRAVSISGNYVVEEVVDWRVARIGKYFNAPKTEVAQPMTPLGEGAQAEVRVSQGTYLVVGGQAIIPWR